MPTPFSEAPAGDLGRQAALQGLRSRSAPASPQAGPAAPGGPTPGGPGQVTEQVGAALAQVIPMITSAPPEELPAVFQQVEQFFLALQEIAGQGAQGQQQPPQGQPAPAPQGAPPPL